MKTAISMNLGKAAYEASRSGPLSWDQLSVRTQAHWDSVARAVVQALVACRDRQVAEARKQW